MSLTCVSKGAASDTPVIFAPGSSLLFTSLASTASVTALKTTGVFAYGCIRRS